MNIIFSVSTITGNTEKIAAGLREELRQMQYSVIPYNDTNKEAIADAGIVILCFWCRRSSVDPKTQKIIDTLHGKKIIAFGTMGAYPDSKYGDHVKENVRTLIEADNKCLGVFLCQGKIPPERTERRRKLPPDSPHYLDDEGYQRHLESRKHPDERDIADAGAFLRQILKNNGFTNN